MDQIQHRYVEVNGLKLHVAETETGPAAVMFLHGFPGYSWHHQMIAVADAGYRAISPNYRDVFRFQFTLAADGGLCWKTAGFGLTATGGFGDWIWQADQGFQHHLRFSLGSLRALALNQQKQLSQHARRHRLPLAPLRRRAQRQQRPGRVLHRRIRHLQYDPH
ncbi:hypothetical protein RHGRI_029936 [Rhododendron griersonianum]|uniref:Uncharacterized protein n=1 Tax=Rhododendron griersonianum TaxID=479676 RepID=A0AAV6IS45_9ERIC|nr:hypothetical protein RHGRI_029936 [Rhododendron griersonianum]